MIFDQTLSYDPAGNVTSLSTTQAAVPNTTNSGGSETEAFCYDEQNRLVWTGNTGTPPAAGNGTCGSGPNNNLAGATYSNAYVYTHLGQLWQGPLNGGSAQKQYLYCSSSQPHQLTGLYGTSATCATKSGQVYGSSYDAWGNVTSRSITNGTTLLNYTLSYDGLDHLVRWNDSQTTANEEWYMYDTSGNRVLKRSATGTGTSNTKITLYPFGVEEHTYDGAGTLLFSKYYYRLGGHLIGKSDGSATSFFVTDALGSVLANFSAKVSSAALLGNQTYGPYGSTQYQKGTLGTSKGFTGQYNDGLTTLDYYGSRYYDPAVGVFLSADSVLGNLQGANPYAYVGGNPETYSDPTGRYVVGLGGQRYYPPPPILPWNAVQSSNLPPGGTSSLQPFNPPSGPSNPFTQKHTVVTTSPSSVSQVGGLSSCGTVQPSQPSCGILPALYAVYSSTGGAIGVPGPFCVWCGSGGGSNDSGRSGSGNDLTNELASSAEWGSHDPELQLELYDEAQFLRVNYGIKTGNVAFIEYIIGGESGERVANSGTTVEGTVGAPPAGERLFKTFEVGGYNRLYDAEVKLYEFIGNQYRENPNVSGTLKLFSELEPCPSCAGVETQFRERFPNIEVLDEWFLDRQKQHGV